ncbi:hypothetical protein [Methylorubrum salsuginis]|uniref:Uncharacterized protein n=1 Tax=Methylorubrum salsuginis TaxID=414703 RepID=A0A1I4CTM8_9HYPH|nr:hypothetical protein [Methylorubrum salsuginis]SFK84255.1 hypothetical protein SAMN04488125_1053 [Methylorubrum salsuginis]
MAFRSETPPPPADRAPEAPPASAHPTVAQLKAQIDAGVTGDKVAAHDPGLSPLGTDDEAAGRPPEPARIAEARRQEAHPRRLRAALMATGQGPNRWVMPLYAGIVLGAAALIGLGWWLVP